jgi:acyl-CoA reductase-like NAD-dependent aldehyde dehydrogenase
MRKPRLTPEERHARFVALGKAAYARFTPEEWAARHAKMLAGQQRRRERIAELLAAADGKPLRKRKIDKNPPS